MGPKACTYYRAIMAAGLAGDPVLCPPAVRKNHHDGNAVNLNGVIPPTPCGAAFQPMTPQQAGATWRSAASKHSDAVEWVAARNRYSYQERFNK
jgi:hypothetical protein